jgi:uncharacterized protein DUF5666
MRARFAISLVATGVLLTAWAGTAFSQEKTPIGIAELFSKAKPGTWLRLEGLPQGDQTIRCTKARLITGVIEDDDWTIKGQVRSVDPANRHVTIGRHRVKVADAPKFTSPANSLRGFSDLKVGMYVKVEGTYGRDYGFVARKVDDQSADASRKAGSEKKILHEGKVERVDMAKKVIVLMGSTFVLSQDTEATSVVEI